MQSGRQPLCALGPCVLSLWTLGWSVGPYTLQDLDQHEEVPRTPHCSLFQSVPFESVSFSNFVNSFFPSFMTFAISYFLVKATELGSDK